MSAISTGSDVSPALSLASMPAAMPSMSLASCGPTSLLTSPNANRMAFAIFVRSKATVRPSRLATLKTSLDMGYLLK